MTVVVNNWFPTSIYVAESIVSSKYNDLLKQKSLEIEKISENGASNWQCNTYNTLGTFDLKEDPLFSDLLKEIEFHVKKFTEMHGSDYQYTCKESWLNLNYKNSYQEYHCHSNSISVQSTIFLHHQNLEKFILKIHVNQICYQ